MSAMQINNARLIDPAQTIDRVSTLYIENGHIAGVDEIPAGFDVERAQTIDADGRWLIPGLVDLSTWLREPGLDHKATLASETRAAATSGITTLCFQPEPAVSIDDAATVNLIQDINADLGKANIQVIGNFTKQLKGKQLSNMGGLKNAGCVGVTNGLQPMQDLRVMRTAMEYAVSHDLTVFLYPLEHALAHNGFVHESEISTRLGFAGIPAAAESVAVAQILALIEMTGTRVHFCRISAAASVRQIRKAKAAGLPVTADVAAHQLFLLDTDVSDFNPLCHVMPPLRSQQDRDALREGLADNTIDAICSDHQPHDLDAKLAPFQQTEPGISALETLLPLTLRLVEEDVLSLPQALSKVTQHPARIIGSQRGTLAAERPADLVLIDPDAFWELSLEQLVSKGKNTPFAGWGFNGKVERTLLAGRIVFERESS